MIAAVGSFIGGTVSVLGLMLVAPPLAKVMVAIGPSVEVVLMLLALSVNPGHASHALLVAGGGFAVSVLSREQLDLARHFGTRSARETDKLAGISWRAGRTGAPILTEALAYLECQLTQRIPAGDHEIVVGRPVAGEILRPTAVPLTYTDTGELDGSQELYPPSL